jgi:Na+/H+ antiporter NhaA
MSLFVFDLAFQGDPLLDTLKVAILGASAVAGVSGWLVLRRTAGMATSRTSSPTLG